MKKQNRRYCDRATLENGGSGVCRKNLDDPEREKPDLNAYARIGKNPMFGEIKHICLKEQPMQALPDDVPRQIHKLAGLKN